MSHSSTNVQPPVFHGQEMPPLDGFSRVHFQRFLPKRGPPGWALFLAWGLATIYGAYTVKQGIDIRWETDRETMQGNLHITPFLEAEKDRMIIRALHESRRYEEFVMKQKYPEWNAHESLFHSRKYFTPEYLVAPPNSDLFRYPIFRNGNRILQT